MELKQAKAELTDLARQLSHAPIPEALALSGQVLVASMRLAEEGDEEEDPERAAENAAMALLDANLERFPKKPAWWAPPHNLLINQALMGYNLWRFTILPMFPKKRAYSETLKGIVIHPIWTPVSDKLYGVLDSDLAQKMIAVAKQSSTVQESVRQELAWMEREFSIDIPESIKAQLVKEAVVTAKRRWGVDRLRVKDRLVPLDGSKGRDLGSWDAR